MNLLQWKPEYSVGIESMDTEHREMIDLINDVYARLGTSPDAEDIENCLENIYSTISMHFALEERLMRDNLYAEYDDHKEDHEDLLDEIRELMDDFLADTDSGAVRLQGSLSGWFARHFSTFDARLHGKLG